MSASRSKHTYLAARYRRLVSRRGPSRTIVGIEHSILVAVWNMLATGRAYADPGLNYYTRLNPHRAKNHEPSQVWCRFLSS